MGTEQLINCKNCGAKLAPGTGNTIKCDYCGSVYDNPNYRPAPVAPINDEIEEDVYVRPVACTPQPPKGGSSATTWGVVLAIGIVFAIIVIAVMSDGSGNTSTSAAADTAAVDTATKDRARAAADSAVANVDTSANVALRELAAINVDAPTFKKIYASAHKKRDEFSKSTFIYDPTSTQFVNVNGVFLYVSISDGSSGLRLETHYVAEDWLFISQMVINADGENFTFNPEFKRDNGDGKIWEWSDAAIADSDLSIMAKMAAAKKAQVKFEGDKYYHVVILTKPQQLAIKRQLQIYKGLLLKYDKPKSNKGS